LTARLAKTSDFPGAMISVGLSEVEIQTYLEQVASHFGENGIAVGCVNSPKNVTITGREDQIDVLRNLMKEKNIFARKLLVNVPYHSRYLESIAAEYLDLMGNLSSQQVTETATMISSVTADRVTVDELCSGHYWVRNLVSRVRFSEALARACVPPSQGPRTTTKESTQPQIDDLLEIGPHCALQGPIRETLKTLTKAKPIEYSSTLVRFVPATESLPEALGRLHCGGHSIDLSRFNKQGSTSAGSLDALVGLPEYPFDHSVAYWRESRLSQGYRFRKEPRNDFLGIPVPDWSPLEARWRRKIRLGDSPWLEDHKVGEPSFLALLGMINDL
jgi:acyl transferase domain-containing protein